METTLDLNAKEVDSVCRALKRAQSTRGKHAMGKGEVWIAPHGGGFAMSARLPGGWGVVPVTGYGTLPSGAAFKMSELLDAVKAANGSRVKELSVGRCDDHDGGFIRLTAGNVTVKWGGEAMVSAKPPVPALDGPAPCAVMVKIPTLVWVASAAAAASDSPARPALLNVSFADGRMVASDGFRLHSAPAAPDGQWQVPARWDGGPQLAAVAARLIADVVKVRQSGDITELSFFPDGDDARVVCRTSGGILFVADAAPAMPPNFRIVLDGVLNGESLGYVYTAELAGAVKACAGPVKAGAIRFSVDGKRLGMDAALCSGSASTSVPLAPPYTPPVADLAPFSLAVPFLTDALAGPGSSLSLWQGVGRFGAIGLLSADADTVAVVMPMHIR